MDGFGIGDIPPHRMPRVLDILRVVNLQHLVTVMVDDLDGDLASLRRVEGAAGGGEFARGLDVVELEVLLLAGYVAFEYGPSRVSISFHKSLREIADPTELGSAPAA